MYENNLVSIIIPTFNRENTINKCIQKCLDQTYQNIEILVVDDGSTDKTKNTVESISSDKIRYFRIPNSGGPARPRNIGLQNSKGIWIAFLDSDDYWTSEKLMKQITAAKKNNAQFICSNAYINTSSETYLKLRSDCTFNFGSLLKTNNIICSSVLINRSLIENLYFNESKEINSYEDYLLWLTITMRGYNTYYLSEPLLSYTVDSVNSIRLSNKLNDLQRLTAIFNSLKSNNTNPVNKALLFSKYYTSKGKAYLKDILK